MSFADPIIQKTGLNKYSVSHGDDTQNYVVFEQIALQNEAKSKIAGCPQFDNVDFCTIMFPGDKTKVVKKKVTDDLKMRYPNQWKAYQEGRKQVPNGFPIEEWPILTKAEALNLKSNGIHTVEQLANIPDTSLDVILGARSYREKAKTTLAKATDASAVLALQSENEQLKEDMKLMQQQIKDLASLAAQPKEEPSKPKKQG